MMKNKLLSGVRNNAGTGAMEFAIIVTPLMLSIFAFLSLAHTVYMSAVLQGAVTRAGRLLSVQNSSMATQNTLVNTLMQDVAPAGATLTFTQNNYNTFSAINSPEPFIDTIQPTDTMPNNWCDGPYKVAGVLKAPAERYQDVDGSNAWDAINNGAPGPGGANAVVVYRAKMTYTPLIPISMLFGSATNTKTLTAQTVLRNQPFGVSTVPIWKDCTDTSHLPNPHDP